MIITSSADVHLREIGLGQFLGCPFNIWYLVHLIIGSHISWRPLLCVIIADRLSADGIETWLRDVFSTHNLHKKSCYNTSVVTLGEPWGAHDPTFCTPFLSRQLHFDTVWPQGSSQDHFKLNGMSTSTWLCAAKNSPVYGIMHMDILPLSSYFSLQLIQLSLPKNLFYKEPQEIVLSQHAEYCTIVHFSTSQF